MLLLHQLKQPYGRLAGGRIMLPEDAAMDHQWVYLISFPREGLKALRCVDTLPSDVLTGMGIAACDTPVTWYVYAVASSPSGAQNARILWALDSVGTVTDLTVEDLLSRRLSFFASGPLQAIEFALARWISGRSRPRPMNLTHLLTTCAMDADRMGIPAGAAAVWLYGPGALCPLVVVVVRPERPEAATPKVWGIVLRNAMRRLAPSLPTTPQAAVLLFPRFENFRVLEAAGAGAQEATATPYLAGAASNITIQLPAAKSAAAVLLAQAQQIHAAQLN